MSENYVFLLLRDRQRLSYYYENGVEIDFLTEDDTLIESKYNTELDGQQLQVFQDHPARRKYVINSVKGLSVVDTLWET